jgi:hypothetical protein
MISYDPMCLREVKLEVEVNAFVNPAILMGYDDQDNSIEQNCSDDCAEKYRLKSKHH